MTEAAVITSLNNLTLTNASVNGTAPPTELPAELDSTVPHRQLLNFQTQTTPFGLTNVTAEESTEIQDETSTEELVHPDDAGVVMSGNYVINKCGPAGGNSRAQHLADLLPHIWSTLQKTIYEVDNKGVSSVFGYYAFFKTTENQAAVSDIYQKIANGTLLDVGTPGSGLYYPQFLCINKGDPEVIGAYNFCQGSSGHRPIAYHSTQTNLVALCDEFWRLAPVPSHAYCPTTTTYGVVSPNSPWLQYTRSGAIIHELTEMYLNEKANVSLIPETYLVADAVALTASSAILNPSNFAFFYSAIKAGCTSWPKAPKASLTHDGLRF
ncbi:MAG: hypothetical protein M1828_002618 [Chrysothrix sp. TS-e1954]|nr:MAG: hypothetical protein M1828_002618 [Chrysothrix sp. TS-e1954]